MSKRPKFSLVRMENPASAEIFRQDEQRLLDGGEFIAGSQVSVRRPSWQDSCVGVIVRIGTKASLSNLRILQDTLMVVEVGKELRGGSGETEQKKYLPTRYRAFCLAKESTRDANIQNFDEILAEQGPGSLEQRPSVSRLPKKRPADQMKALQDSIASWPCFHQKPGDMELVSHSKVYIKATRLVNIDFACREDPRKMFVSIMRELVPVSRSGLTRTGRRGTVAIPTPLLDAIETYTRGHSKGANFVRDKLVRNELTYQQRASTPTLSSAAAPQPSQLTAACNSTPTPTDTTQTHTVSTNPPVTLTNFTHTASTTPPVTLTTASNSHFNHTFTPSNSYTLNYPDAPQNTAHTLEPYTHDTPRSDHVDSPIEGAMQGWLTLLS